MPSRSRMPPAPGHVTVIADERDGAGRLMHSCRHNQPAARMGSRAPCVVVHWQSAAPNLLSDVATPMLVDVTPILAVVGAKRLTVRERCDDVIVGHETQLTRWLLQRRSHSLPSRCGASRLWRHRSAA